MFLHITCVRVRVRVRVRVCGTHALKQQLDGMLLNKQN